MTATESTYTITIAEVAGEPMLDAAGMALLYGVELEAVRCLPFAHGPGVRIPRAWVKRGIRRAREAQAHTGETDWDAILAYWARKDHGAELKVVLR